MPKLTPNEKLMDADGDGKVTKAERKAFRGQAPETVAGKWGIAYALISQLGQSEDADAKSFYDWFQGQVSKYLKNPTGFSDTAFKIEFDAQPWAQKYKSDAIKDMDFEARFPDLYKQQVNADIETLRDQVVQFGVDVTDQELRDLVIQRRRFGMNEAQLQNTLADLATAKGGDFKGSAGELQQNIKGWAYRNGISLSDGLVADYVRRVQAGDTTENDVLMDLRRTYLAGAYPAWADRIDAGYDIADIAAPYKQKMADLLEVDPNSIDFNDTLLQRGLQGVDSQGKPSVVPLYEFEKQIREDPRWQYTDNAYSTYTDVGTKLLSMFGFR